MTVQEVKVMAEDCLRHCGVDPRVVVRQTTGDEGCDGCVDIDGVIIYPERVGSDIGWAAYAEVITPGRRTLANGDPGWPDEPDCVDLVSPRMTTQSIRGEMEFARPPHLTVREAVRRLLEERLSNWQYFPEEVGA